MGATPRFSKLLIVLFLIIVFLIILTIPILNLERKMKVLVEDSFEARFRPSMDLIETLVANRPDSLDFQNMPLLKPILRADYKLLRFVIADSTAIPIFTTIVQPHVKLPSLEWKPEIGNLYPGRITRSDFHENPDHERLLWLYYPLYHPRTKTLQYVIGYEVDGHQLWLIDRTLMVISSVQIITYGAIVWSLIIFIVILISPFNKLVNLAASVRPQKNNRNYTIDQVLTTFRGVVDDLHQKEEKLKRLHESAEERADRAEIYTRDILRSMTSGVLTFDLSGQLLVHNDAALNILGIELLPMARPNWSEFFDQPGELNELISQAFATRTVFQRREIIWPDKDSPDQPRWLAMSSSLLKSADGQIEGITFVFDEVTETKILQRRLEQERHLAALGEMSAGIAHEFRNSLGVILGLAQLLQKQSEHAQTVNGVAKGIMNEVQISQDMIKSFLEFARPPKIQLTTIDVNGFLDDILMANQTTAVHFAKSFDPHLPKIKGDEIMLKSVFQNIIQNAIQAMTTDGILTCQTLWPNGSVYVQIAIADNGAGIKPADLAKVTTPFFTTRKDGTGLGLAIAQRNINAHGGDMSIASEPGQGTTVTIKLPV